MSSAGPMAIPDDYSDSDSDQDDVRGRSPRGSAPLSPRLAAAKQYLDSVSPRLSPTMSPKQKRAQRTPSVSPSPEPTYRGRERSPSPIILADDADAATAAERRAQRTPSVSPSPEARVANKRQRTPSVSPSPEPRYAGRERSPSPEIQGGGKAAAKRLRAEKHDREEEVSRHPVSCA